MSQPYCELHLHTHYSFLEGASHPRELAYEAARQDYQALAITDHDGLHGAMLFAQDCRDYGLRPITGVELTLRHPVFGHTHLTLLAESLRGYANICRLVTEAHRAGGSEDVALDPAALRGHTEGIIALSGCREGELSQLIDRGRFADATAAARRLAETFDAGSVYVELQHNLVHGDTQRIARLAQLAESLSLPIVATGNVHYHVRERHRLQDTMVAVKHRTTLEASHRLRRPNSEFYLRSPAEMAAVFARYPQAIANTAVISERCSGFVLTKHGDIGYVFPDFARQEDELDKPAGEVLASHCWGQFDHRYPVEEVGEEVRDKARAQLKDELELVAKHNLAGFFLIYRDLQSLASEVAANIRGADVSGNRCQLPPGRGRGSSVSSITCYLIGLSHVDPVRNRLFFRRFLNEDLQAVPDIDLDFSREIREKLILRVYERYGADHAALVCSFATYHIRSAIRDLGKALGLPLPALDKLAKLSEGGSGATLAAELRRIPEFASQTDGPLWRHLVELAGEIDNFPRHVSQHVGGMIISSRPLVEIVPVQPAAMEGRFICQWDKDSCDDARFIKIDFLALGMLSLVEECLEMIGRNHGHKVDLTALTCEDTAVFDEIQRGDTIGTFQIESRAQIQMLPRTRPANLDDLAVQVAIVRPGPIVANAVNPYVRHRELQRAAERGDRRAALKVKGLRTMGRTLPPELRQKLDDILRDTLGVIIFQDQVLEVAIAVAGFQPGQADQFRRAMSRRRSKEEMDKFRGPFVSGAVARGANEQEANDIFEKLSGFSDFGFPKSHAYAFAVLAYQSAWLRHYYMPEYYAALLNNQPMGFYEPNVLINDVKRHGVQVLRVSLNRSEVRCSAGDGHILLGLGLIHDMSEDLAKAIVAEREANGSYRSLPDFLRRTSVPRHICEHLIAVGALSEFGLSRRELLWQLGLLLPESSAMPALRPRKSRPQLTLELPTEQDMVTLDDMTEWERMAADYRLLRLSPTAHPIGLLRRDIPPDVLTAEQLRQAGDGYARTAGMVVCRQRPGTAKGIVFLLIEDETGVTNVVVKPELYETHRSLVRGEPYLVVEGEIQVRSGSLNLLAHRIERLAARPLPRVPLRHSYPGHPHDVREHPELVAPPSHDFH
jgi:error-prone DNA polymerase